MEMLLTVITLWLSANFDLAVTDRRPQIVFASPQEIEARHYRGLLPATESDVDRSSPLHQEQSVQGQIVAIYVDETETIYLPLGWTGDSPRDVSVLVHETVHHLQNVNGHKHACAQERERLAFAAQEQWLNMFGTSLREAFGIDAFTLLLRTNCPI